MTRIIQAMQCLLSRPLLFNIFISVICSIPFIIACELFFKLKKKKCELRGSVRKNQAECESSPSRFFQISMNIRCFHWGLDFRILMARQISQTLNAVSDIRPKCRGSIFCQNNMGLVFQKRIVSAFRNCIQSL